MNIKYLFFLEIISITAFMLYGVACIFVEKFVDEFKRYGLSKFRVLTGVLEILGSLGLFLGFYIPILKTLAALGLTLLMISGVIVRIKIRDSLFQILPALVLMVFNFLIFYYSLT